MILSSESFATDVTGIWSLISVGPLMDQQVVTLGKVPVAVLADELFLGSCSPAWSSEQSGIIGRIQGGR